MKRDEQTIRVLYNPAQRLIVIDFLDGERHIEFATTLNVSSARILAHGLLSACDEVERQGKEST